MKELILAHSWLVQLITVEKHSCRRIRRIVATVRKRGDECKCEAGFLLLFILT